MAADGKVGPQTWAALFPGEAIPAPAIAAKPLDYRCLALTGSFETEAPIPDCFAGLAGNFDGMGISFGALQWNLGQGSLQPMLKAIDQEHPDVIDELFQDQATAFRAMLAAEPREQLAWARSIQDTSPPRPRVAEPWHGLFKALGQRDECQQAQLRAAQELYQDALALCKSFGVWSERAVALLFDIKVQNGSISPAITAQIRQDFANLAAAASDNDAEVARLRIIANRRADAASAAWAADVRARKLTIANGVGTVHGRAFDLEQDYAIALRPFAPPPESNAGG
jgi:hypothetical protein